MDPASQELQLRRAGVPLANIHRDVGVSGSIGTQERRAWVTATDSMCPLRPRRGRRAVS